MVAYVCINRQYRRAWLAIEFKRILSRVRIFHMKNEPETWAGISFPEDYTHRSFPTFQICVVLPFRHCNPCKVHHAAIMRLTSAISEPLRRILNNPLLKRKYHIVVPRLEESSKLALSNTVRNWTGEDLIRGSSGVYLDLISNWRFEGWTWIRSGVVNVDWPRAMLRFELESQTRRYFYVVETRNTPQWTDTRLTFRHVFTFTKTEL